MQTLHNNAKIFLLQIAILSNANEGGRDPIPSNKMTVVNTFPANELMSSDFYNVCQLKVDASIWVRIKTWFMPDGLQ